MRKKIICILVMMLLIATVLPAVGTENKSNAHKNEIALIEFSTTVSNNLEVVIDSSNPGEASCLNDVFEIYEGLHWRLTVTVYWDPPDPEKQICLWVDYETLPAGATFPECICDLGEVSGVLDWTPSIGQAGTYEIVFYAGENCYDPVGSFTITVIVYPYEPEPQDTYEIYEGQEWQLIITASWVPPEPERPICLWVDPDTFPDGATFTECHCEYGEVSGILDWTPVMCQSGRYMIIFYAGDACGEYVFLFSIEVVVYCGFVYDIVFEQLDWYDSDGTLVLKDSIWGFMEFEYQPDVENTYYLNVVASSNEGSSEPGWVIQNMPLFPWSTSTVRFGADVNLEEIGIYSGMDLKNIELIIKVGSTILTSKPDNPSKVYVVRDSVRNAWNDIGSPDMSAPFTNPGKPDGVKNADKEKAKPAPRDVKPVQEDKNKCFPGSVARSLDWLNRKHKLGIQKDAKKFYDELKEKVKNPQGTNVKENETWKINKKNEYAKQVSNNKIVTKVYDAIDYVDPINGVDEKTPNDETLFEFLKREWATEDIELAFFSTSVSHIVTIVGVYETKDGKFKVKYRDDENQSNPNDGDSSIKEAEITKLPNGRYTFKSSSFQVWYVLSESVKEVENKPPEKPAKPEGTTKGKAGNTYTYTSGTTDPDGDSIQYLFDWDDGTDSGWTDPLPSGEPGAASHIWAVQGDYQIRVRARDTNLAESDWSDPLSISMPKTNQFLNRPFPQFLQNFLENHPILYQLLQRFLRL